MDREYFAFIPQPNISKEENSFTADFGTIYNFKVICAEHLITTLPLLSTEVFVHPCTKGGGL